MNLHKNKKKKSTNPITCRSIHSNRKLSIHFLSLILIILSNITFIESKFTLKIQSPKILEDHFKEKGIKNVQILEGSKSFMFEEILNIVTFNSKTKAGCHRFEQGTKSSISLASH